jgi:hypothetical protein
MRDQSGRGAGLFDLGFLELDMLARDGIIFAERHLFRLIPGVFLRYIEEAGVSAADETDFDGGWLRHGLFLRFESLK